MPYKSTEQARQASKERMKRYRGVTLGVTKEGVTSQGVTLPPTWEYINKHGLEKVQAIVTSLGKYAGEVFLGNVSAKQIRDVIGEHEALPRRVGGIV